MVEGIILSVSPEGNVSWSAWTVRRRTTHSFSSPGGETVKGERVGNAVNGNQNLLSFDRLVLSYGEKTPSKASDETVPPIDVDPYIHILSDR